MNIRKILDKRGLKILILFNDISFVLFFIVYSIKTLIKVIIILILSDNQRLIITFINHIILKEKRRKKMINKLIKLWMII
jgi:hypothetical protein